jgi:uncharacterized membrane protein YoaK (UPF0700 family)
MARKNFTSAWYFLAYVLAFLAGAFVSNFIVEVTERVAKRYVNAAPVFVEIALLAIVIIVGARGVQQHQHLIALLLLFAMGLQNAMVTRISNAVVRTTHLTGLFTDLGIELSQLFFYRKKEQQRKLAASVKLRFAVIGFFFLGCIIGGIGYVEYHMEILYLAIVVLFVGIIYSNIRYRYLLLRKSIGNANIPVSGE